MKADEAAKGCGRDGVTVVLTGVWLTVANRRILRFRAARGESQVGSDLPALNWPQVPMALGGAP